MTGSASTIAIVTDRIPFATKGDCHILDVTPEVAAKIECHGFVEGHALVFVSGSTAAITTIEHEPGLLRDLPEAFERLAPRGIRYHHEEAWHDGNGHSHVRAALLGPSLMVPFEEGRLLLGTWQQIVLIDFDNRPRKREIVVQLSGTRVS